MRDDAIIDIASALGKAEVWKKGVVVDGYDPNLFRQDCCGAWIACGKYGDTSNPNGWEVDHVMQKSMGGGDQLEDIMKFYKIIAMLYKIPMANSML